MNRPTPPPQDGFAQPPCLPHRPLYPSVSSDSASACSTPDHDCDRTQSVASHSSDTSLPDDQLPLGYDDLLPLQTLRSYTESITDQPQPKGAFLGRLRLKHLTDHCFPVCDQNNR